MKTEEKMRERKTEKWFEVFADSYTGSFTEKHSKLSNAIKRARELRAGTAYPVVKIYGVSQSKELIEFDSQKPPTPHTFKITMPGSNKPIQV